jgi:NAD dependent epimerase/dehydratase family enzyme
VVPLPTFALRAAIGEFADEAVSSQRVLPRVLLDAGYPFQHTTVEQAVDAALHA